jgi:hypothetical protein
MSQINAKELSSDIYYHCSTEILFLSRYTQKRYSIITHTFSRKLFIPIVDRISIDEIVGSPILIEFNELLNDDIPEQDLNENWFSLANTQSIHGLFKQLNLAMSGSLSRNEIRGFNNNSLTMSFIDRMLQEYGSRKGQLVRFILLILSILIPLIHLYQYYRITKHL